jgi:hypothetical protein
LLNPTIYHGTQGKSTEQPDSQPQVPVVDSVSLR